MHDAKAILILLGEWKDEMFVFEMWNDVASFITIDEQLQYFRLQPMLP